MTDLEQQLAEALRRAIPLLSRAHVPPRSGTTLRSMDMKIETVRDREPPAVSTMLPVIESAQGRAQMKGMHKPLWQVFCVVVVAYSLYVMPKFVLWTAAAVFIGGGLFLTIFAYAAARYSMPRSTLNYLPRDERNTNEKSESPR
jgi:hypothetical protein